MCPRSVATIPFLPNRIVAKHTLVKSLYVELGLISLQKDLSKDSLNNVFL
jgi:hypothetical protein